MTLQSIVTSLELSKKLAEAGFEQEDGIAYWVMYSTEEGGNGNYFLLSAKEYNFSQYKYIFPIRSFVFNELWELLPRKIEKCLLRLGKYKHGEMFIDYEFHTIKGDTEILGGKNRPSIYSGIPQEAAGKLLLWCIENGYVKP